MKKLMYLAICLIVSLGIVGIYPTLLNSFDNNLGDGTWQYTPFSFTPINFFIGLCWLAMIAAAVFGAGWIAKENKGVNVWGVHLRFSYLDVRAGFGHSIRCILDHPAPW